MGRRYCSIACKPPASVWNRDPQQRSCDVCAAIFTTRYLRRRYCSPLCQNRAAVRRRRGHSTNRHFPRVRYRARLAIFERDGWRCGICHALIDRALRWPHPGSSSIDHIDAHGLHEPANWQASHLACNVQKGAANAA